MVPTLPRSVSQPQAPRAQVISRSRRSPTAVYNMDESPFFSRSKSKKVVAVRGSKNVRTTESPTPAHLTYVACVSAAGYVQPPLFIMPSSRSGFMNSTIPILWLDMFSSAIPATTPRPVVLFFDGYKSHISPEIIKRSAVLGILLVCLPPNATHLVEPLDVAVFGQLKMAVRATIRDFMVSSGSSNMSKAQAIKLAGFAAMGLYPPSLPKMLHRLAHFDAGGVSKDTEWDVSWLQRQQVRKGILLLPAPVAPSSKAARKTVDVGGRLLSADDVIAELQPAPKTHKCAKI
ncbi:hypothetical protein ACHHYP_14756 [Achlya hypogyna]|uniref:DDE-1 domain-containing protein n=1 Tax=Achlya hypogyna TaxID=1202772 RepID=A0A1V9YCF6_ACHHY|nr:hypothetical protein ACHHYP_14756 [Achlya hypogyna]